MVVIPSQITPASAQICWGDIDGTTVPMVAFQYSIKLSVPSLLEAIAKFANVGPPTNAKPPPPPLSATGSLPTPGVNSGRDKSSQVLSTEHRKSEESWETVSRHTVSPTPPSNVLAGLLAQELARPTSVRKAPPAAPGPSTAPLEVRPGAESPWSTMDATPDDEDIASDVMPSIDQSKADVLELPVRHITATEDSLVYTLEDHLGTPLAEKLMQLQEICGVDDGAWARRLSITDRSGNAVKGEYNDIELSRFPVIMELRGDEDTSGPRQAEWIDSIRRELEADILKCLGSGELKSFDELRYFQRLGDRFDELVQKNSEERAEDLWETFILGLPSVECVPVFVGGDTIQCVRLKSTQAMIETCNGAKIINSDNDMVQANLEKID